MTDLIDRIEGARVGSRDLDADIYEALGYEVKRHPEHYGGRSFSRSWAYLRNSRWESMSKPSTSVDAALALAERVLPGLTDYRIERDHGQHYARLVLDMPTEIVGFKSDAATPALALCAAILRAKEQGKSDE